MIGKNHIADGRDEVMLRSDVALSLEGVRKSGQQTPLSPNLLDRATARQRETGDQINRFLLCALVSQSAKRIKQRAERSGAALPMAIIARAILRSYDLAAKDHNGPFAKAELDLAEIQRLNDKVLAEVLTRHAQEKVKTLEAQRLRANLVDEERNLLLSSQMLRSAFPGRR